MLTLHNDCTCKLWSFNAIKNVILRLEIEKRKNFINMEIFL